jgi:hypothetical protein
MKRLHYVSRFFFLLSFYPHFVVANPSAFELPEMWIKYSSTISKIRKNQNELTATQRMKGFGLIGTPGFSVGGFLLSPYAEDADTSDVQITLFPTVSDSFCVSLVFSYLFIRLTCSSLLLIKCTIISMVEK